MRSYNKSDAPVGRPRVNPKDETMHTGLRYGKKQDAKVLSIIAGFKKKNLDTNRSEVIREMVEFCLKSHKAEIVASLKQKLLCRKGA